MRPHSWTAADAETWKRLARRARAAIAEADKGPLASAAVMADLGRSARSAFKACFPTRNEDEQRSLAQFLHDAEAFAVARHRVGALLQQRLTIAESILGVRAAGAGPPPERPAATAYWLED